MFFTRDATALSYRTLFTSTGTSGDGLGRAVASAGDLNDDGYDDVVVGAYSAPGGGRAFLFFGGPGDDATADLTFTGTGVAQLGSSVASAGDVNGDGFDDLIVGANQNDAAGSDAGRAYVYFGGPAPDATPDVVLTGAASGDHFGFSVASAGDVNVDGFDDLIVGAYQNDSAGTQAGRAYVYFGGVSPNSTADLVLSSASGGDYFGISVAPAGDVNRDGFDDFLVGAIQNDTGGIDAGRAYLYFGGPNVDATADLAFTGAAAGDWFGRSVASAGDVNADGCADIIVGAQSNDAGGSDAGRAYIFLGGPVVDAVPDFTFTGAAADDHFGLSATSAGDVNRDGFDDVVVGAEWNDAGGANAGRAYVTAIYAYEILSPNGGEPWVAGTEATVRWRGHDVADLAISFDAGVSWSTLAVGVGGDDLNDRVIPVPPETTSSALVRLSYTGQVPAAYNSGASDAVFRIVLPTHPPAAAVRSHLTMTGSEVDDEFGYSVASAGDVNGDGFPDVIVGAYQNDAGGTGAGRAFLYFGGPFLDAVPDLTLTGAAAGDNFGTSVAAAGDLNGDGFDDVIVGAPFNDASGSNSGRAYLFLGGVAPDITADLILTGAAAGDNFGISVASAGDVNGDRFVDLIVGAYQNDAGGSNSGSAYVYFGGPSPDAIADLALVGVAATDFLGASVASAGDVNGDGFDDVIAGAQSNDSGGSFAGQAYVYLGGPVPDAVADLTFTGAAPNDLLGTPVAPAGDVNGDGFGDVLIGAQGSDVGGSNAGRAYVYFGGPAADATADLTLTGAAPGDVFGLSAASAGDVNGDGFDDVVVGAKSNDTAGTNAGRAYVYFGGPGADAIADFTLTGAGILDEFGVSVAPAGDMNGDGFDDLIVGAHLSDDSGTNAGSVGVYDLNRYQILAPLAGVTWNVGATRTIAWLGAEHADVWLSVDGGNTYQELRTGAGGAESNSLPLTVPHQPTRYAKVKLTPTNVAVGGSAMTDSLFTIQSFVTLVDFRIEGAPSGAQGVALHWRTEPGPEDLSGYRLARTVSGDSWDTLVSLTTETSYLDESGAAHHGYRLYAVNGLGEELLVGETPAREIRALASWPLPYRGGILNVSFVAASLGGLPVETEVNLYDVGGRRVRRIAGGQLAAGTHLATWDGKDDRGGRVPPGVYFVRVVSGSFASSLKVTIAR